MLWIVIGAHARTHRSYREHDDVDESHDVHNYSLEPLRILHFQVVYFHDNKIGCTENQRQSDMIGQKQVLKPQYPFCSQFWSQCCVMPLIFLRAKDMDSQMGI